MQEINEEDSLPKNILRSVDLADEKAAEDPTEEAKQAD